jgi:hypothetical protein
MNPPRGGGSNDRKEKTMKRHSGIAKLAVAIGSLAAIVASNGAVAQVYGVQPNYGPPTHVMHGPPAYAYGEAYSYEHEHWRHGCSAPRWDPNQRYLPGEAVWRNGKLYVARGVSRSVYNVNSPPEWTPNYWAQARC